MYILPKSCKDLIFSNEQKNKKISLIYLQGRDYIKVVWDFENNLNDNDGSDVPSILQHVFSSGPTCGLNVFSSPSSYALHFGATTAADHSFGWLHSSVSIFNMHMRSAGLSSSSLEYDCMND